jgi:hypothetical protein
LMLLVAWTPKSRFKNTNTRCTAESPPLPASRRESQEEQMESISYMKMIAERVAWMVDRDWIRSKIIPNIQKTTFPTVSHLAIRNTSLSILEA